MGKGAKKDRRFYFDACVFIALLDKEKDRWSTIQGLMEDAESGELQIYTSQLSVAEVAFSAQEKSAKSLSKIAENKIEKIWHPSSPVVLIDVHPSVATEARNLIRKAMTDGWEKDQQWSLKPPDAIHLATAKILGVSRFFTYDPKLKKLSENVGVDIREPFIDQTRMEF